MGVFPRPTLGVYWGQNKYGLRFVHKPFFLPGFWSGVRIPRLSSIGLSPAVAVFSISAISVATNVRKPIFSSDLISSIPGFLFYFNLLMASIISSVVTGFFIGVGLTSNTTT